MTIESSSMPYDPCTRSRGVELEQPAAERRQRFGVGRKRHHLDAQQHDGRREVDDDAEIELAARACTTQRPGSSSEKLAPSALRRLSQPSMSSLVTIASPCVECW